MLETAKSPLLSCLPCHGRLRPPLAEHATRSLSLFCHLQFLAAQAGLLEVLHLLSLVPGFFLVLSV